MIIVGNISLTEDARKHLLLNYEGREFSDIDDIDYVDTYTHYAWLNDDGSIRAQGVRLLYLPVQHTHSTTKYCVFDKGKKIFGVNFSVPESDLKYLGYSHYDENHRYDIDYIDGVNYIVESKTHPVISEMLERIRSK